MNHVFAVALQGMQHDMARMDRTAMNLANLQTAGYKRDVLAVRPFGQLVAAMEGMAPVTSGIPQGQAESPLVSQFDHHAGALRSTNQSLDFALQSDGWFEISTPEGPTYTRQGNFRVDARGRLVTAQGHPVMGKGGEIVLPSANPTVDSAGRIFANESTRAASGSPAAPIAQLRVVRLEAGVEPQRIGDGMLSGKVQGMDDGEVDIRQGYLENSNVSPMHEMVQMIQTMRHFESMQKVAVSYDEMMGSAIRKLGDPA